MRGILSRQAPGAPLKLNSLLPAHRHAVDAAELEAAHGEPGKYTEGLMMREWSACDEDEDVVTMASCQCEDRGRSRAQGGDRWPQVRDCGRDDAFGPGGPFQRSVWFLEVSA